MFHRPGVRTGPSSRFPSSSPSRNRSRPSPSHAPHAPTSRTGSGPVYYSPVPSTPPLTPPTFYPSFSYGYSTPPSPAPAPPPPPPPPPLPVPSPTPFLPPPSSSSMSSLSEQGQVLRLICVLGCLVILAGLIVFGLSYLFPSFFGFQGFSSYSSSNDQAGSLFSSSPVGLQGGDGGQSPSSSLFVPLSSSPLAVPFSLSSSSSSLFLYDTLVPSSNPNIYVMIWAGQSNGVGNGVAKDITLDCTQTGRLYQYVIGDACSEGYGGTDAACPSTSMPNSANPNDANMYAGQVIPFYCEPSFDSWPQEISNAYNNRISSMMSFAQNYLATYPTRLLIMIQSAVGGTTFSGSPGYWLPPSDILVPRLTTAAYNVKQMFPQSKLVAMVWDQGESDVGHLSDSVYQADVLSLFAFLRANSSIGFTSTTCIMIVSLNPYWVSINSPSPASIQAILAGIPSIYPYTSYILGPGGSDATYSDGGEPGPVHYNALAQRYIGTMLNQSLPQCQSNSLNLGSSSSTGSSAPAPILLWDVSFLGTTSTNYLDTSPNPLTEAHQHGTPTFTTTGYQFPAYDTANSPFPSYEGLPLGCRESFTVNFWWKSGIITSSDTGTGGLICASQANPSDGCGDWLVQFAGYLASPTSTNCGINFFFGAGDSGGLAGTPNGGCIPYVSLALTYPTHIAIQWVYNPAQFGNGLASFYLNGTLLSNTYPTTGSGNVYQCTSDGTQTCDGSAWNFAVGTPGGESFSTPAQNQYIKIGCNYPANGLLWDAQIWSGTASISTIYNPFQSQPS